MPMVVRAQRAILFGYLVSLVHITFFLLLSNPNLISSSDTLFQTLVVLEN